MKIFRKMLSFLTGFTGFDISRFEKLTHEVQRLRGEIQRLSQERPPWDEDFESQSHSVSYFPFSGSRSSFLFDSTAASLYHGIFYVYGMGVEGDIIEFGTEHGRSALIISAAMRRIEEQLL